MRFIFLISFLVYFNPIHGQSKPDTSTLNCSYKVYNLDDTGAASLHRNDSIYQFFDVKQSGFSAKDFVLKKDGDSTYFLCFRHIGTCCPDPDEMIYSENNTLFLFYKFKDGAGFCDALCTYIFIYGFRTTEIEEYEITVKP